MGEKTAVVFPGQGSQRPGMGKDYFDNISVSKQVYEEAADALHWNVAELCFGDDERLNITEYTQPCILTTEIAALRGIESLFGFTPEVFGGHSLGEFTALVAAGVMPLAETLQIVHVRGQLMQKAVPLGIGGMAAVISADLDLDMVQKSIQDLPIDMANANSSHQVVISGTLSAFPEAERRLREAFAHDQGFRFVPLNVSAPFHSRYMQSIGPAFAEALRQGGNNIVPEKACRVTSNFTGSFHVPDRKDIFNGLIQQLSSTVRWKDNMNAIAARADKIYEIGPSRPLREFFKTIDVAVASIINLSTAERTLGAKASESNS